MSTIRGYLDTQDFITFNLLDVHKNTLKTFTGKHNALPEDSIEYNTEKNTIKVTERANHPALVGLLDLQDKTIHGFTSNKAPLYMFYPYDKRYPPFKVGCTEKNKEVNRIALVKFMEWQPISKFPRGTLERIIGPAGDLTVEIQGLLHYASPHYNAKKDLNYIVPDSNDSAPRKVLGPEWKTINIDPPGCKDIDDVISLWQHPYGDWLIAISIADVDDYIQAKTASDQYALSTSQTVYNDGVAVRPMLPFNISEGVCSLIPGTEKKTVSLMAKWNGSCLQIDKFYTTTLTNNASYTYESIMDPSVNDKFPIGVIKDIVSYLGGEEAVSDSHKWVEELMKLYNREAAKIILKEKSGLLRCHSESQQEKLTALLAAGIDSQTASRLAATAAKYSAVIPSTADSILETYKHWSLGDIHYCHATSPIRRYADLVNQRILKGTLYTGNNIIAIADYINRREKVVKQVDRDILLLRQLNSDKNYEYARVLWKTENNNWKLWVPSWERMVTYRPSLSLIKLRDKDEDFKIGDYVMFKVYFNPNKNNWKNRMVLEVI